MKMTQRRRDPAPLRKIQSAFEFLVLDYGLELISTTVVNDLDVVTYRNAFVQVEIAGKSSYFHAELRRMINGAPAEYRDRANCIGLECIARLEDPEYDLLGYSAYGEGGLDRVLIDTVGLFKRNARVFTTNEWINYDQYLELWDAWFEAKHGFKPDRKQIFEHFDEAITPILSEGGFEIEFDSRNVAPYDRRHLTD